MLVCKDIGRNDIGRNGNTSFMMFISTDIDECTAESYSCMDESYCSNTVGSYECVCNAGYTMNQAEDACEGRFNLIMLILVWITTYGPILLGPMSDMFVISAKQK